MSGKNRAVKFLFALAILGLLAFVGILLYSMRPVGEPAASSTTDSAALQPQSAPEPGISMTALPREMPKPDPEPVLPKDSAPVVEPPPAPETWVACPGVVVILYKHGSQPLQGAIVRARSGEADADVVEVVTAEDGTFTLLLKIPKNCRVSIYRSDESLQYSGTVDWEVVQGKAQIKMFHLYRDGAALRGSVTRKAPLAYDTVTLTLFHQGYESVGEARCDAEGKFVLPYPNAGDYVLSAEIGSSVYKWDLELSEGGDEVALRLPSGDATLTGKVYDSGRGVAGVSMQLVNVDESGDPEKEDPDAAELPGEFWSRSDAEGRYSFTGMAEGKYYLCCFDRGVFLPVTLRRGDNTLDWETPHGVISGSAHDATTGKPVVQFTVTVTRLAGESDPAELRDILESSVYRSRQQGVSDEQGRFEMTDLKTGLYHVMFFEPDFGEFKTEVAIRNDLDHQTVVASLGAGAGAKLTVTAGGAPAKSPVYLLRNLDTGDGLIDPTQDEVSGRTLSYKPGRYLFAAVAPGRRVAYQAVELVEGRVTEIKLDLPEAKPFTFNVFDQDQNPLGNVTLSLALQSAGTGDFVADIIKPLLDTQKRNVTSTDSAGNISIDTLPDGDYLLTATKDGYQPTRQPLTLSGAGAQQVSIILKKE